MKLLASWTDDRLPCFAFEHNNVFFEIWWSDRKIEGRLEMIQDGDITLEKGLHKYPDLLAVLNNPYDCQEQEGLDLERIDERDDGGQLTYQTSVGSINILDKPQDYWD